MHVFSIIMYIGYMGSRHANTYHVPKTTTTTTTTTKKQEEKHKKEVYVLFMVNDHLKEAKDVDETISVGSSFHSRGSFTKEGFVIGCGTSKWNLKGV